MSSPITIDDTPPSTKNRITNNRLDARYFEATQEDHDRNLQYNDDNDDRGQRLDDPWFRIIRQEVIRRMRIAEDEEDKESARELYRILTRRIPREKFVDVQNIAIDCDNAGMLVKETVDLMLSMI